MASIHERFGGLFIPYVTPLNQDGSIDGESLIRLAKYFCAIDSVAGLVSCARIGEGPLLSVEEKRRVYEPSRPSPPRRRSPGCAIWKISPWTA
jgi:dihydrodipicolinate synthase/N-acetylneuraminate lyase